MKQKCTSMARRLLTAAGLTVALAVTSACSTSGDPVDDSTADGTIRLRLADYIPPGHIIDEHGITLWVEEIEARTEGKVHIERYPAGQLLSNDEMFSGLKYSAVDIGFFVPTVSAGPDLPLSDVVQTPGISNDAGDMNRAYQDLLHGFLKKEEFAPNGLEPMFGVIAGGFEVGLAGEPVRTLDDWKGLTIRSPGGVADYVIRALGAAPESISQTETYTALERGTVDGAYNAVEGIANYSFQEVMRSHSSNIGLGGAGAVMATRSEVWDGLPADVQEAFSDANEKVVESLIRAYNDERETNLSEFSEDIDFYEVDRSEQQDLGPAFRAASQEWAQTLESSGHPADAALSAWREAIENAEEHD